MVDTKAGAPLRILLVDDEELVRDGLEMLIDSQNDMCVVGTAGTGSEAIVQARALLPDVVIMDLRMPGMDGVATTRAIVDEDLGPPTQTVRVLVLSSFHDDASVYGALRNGASGFVLKTAVRSELSAAVRHVAAGNAWIDPLVANKLIEEFSRRPIRSQVTLDEIGDLTAREREVLVLLAHGLGTLDIARYFVISDATVKTHVGRILMKLGLRDRAQAVVAAYKSGLVSAGDVLPTRPHQRARLGGA